MKGKFASIKVTEVHCIFTLQFTSISKSNHDCMKICGGVGTHIIKREQRSLFKVKRPRSTIRVMPMYFCTIWMLPLNALHVSSEYNMLHSWHWLSPNCDFNTEKHLLTRKTQNPSVWSEIEIKHNEIIQIMQ